MTTTKFVTFNFYTRGRDELSSRKKLVRYFTSVWT